MDTNDYAGLIESKLLQKIQDYFCEANGVYLACIDKDEGVVTKAYGRVEDKEFIFDLINEEQCKKLEY